jgi:hypothetical protein
LAEDFSPGVNPDAEIAAAAAAIAVTSDSNVLDKAARWVNLGRDLVEARLPQAWVIDLRPDAGRGAA